VDSIYVVQDTHQWQDLDNMVINLHVPYNTGKFSPKINCHWVLNNNSDLRSLACRVLLEKSTVTRWRHSLLSVHPTDSYKVFWH